MSERISTKPKKLYELDPDVVEESLREGKITGFSGDSEGNCERIQVDPALMHAGLFRDLPEYLTVLISRGYQITEGLEEGRVDPTAKLVLEKRRSER